MKQSSTASSLFVARLTEIPIIDDATFFYHVENGELVIEFAVSEDTMTVLNAMVGLSMSFDHEGELTWRHLDFLKHTITKRWDIREDRLCVTHGWPV